MTPFRLALLLLAISTTACGGGSSGGSDSPASPDPADQTATGTGKGTPPPTTGMSSGEQALALLVLDLVNDERAAEGLPPLEVHADASEVAWLHSVDMDERDFFDHTNPDGLGPGDRIADAGIVNYGWGENIAYGYPTPEAVMDAWMNSPGHRANILNASWTHVGIGVHDAPGGPWWTQDFLRIP